MLYKCNGNNKLGNIMAETEAEVLALIEKIDIQIEAILTKPSYKIAEYSVSWSRHLKELRELRKYYQKELETFPYEETTIWRDY